MPARPTIRIIEGLAAAGWSLQWQADQIGTKRQVVNRYLTKETVWSSTEATFVYLASQVGDAIGPSARTQEWAASKGFLRLAWGSDEEIAELRDLPRHSFDDLEFLRAGRKRTCDLDLWWSRYELLLAYVARTGTTIMPSDHIEDGFALYFWMHRNRQRFEYLSDEQKKALLDLPDFGEVFLTKSLKAVAASRSYEVRKATSAA